MHVAVLLVCKSLEQMMHDVGSCAFLGYDFFYFFLVGRTLEQELQRKEARGKG